MGEMVTPLSARWVPLSLRGQNNLPLVHDPVTESKFLSQRYAQSGWHYLQQLGVRELTEKEFLEDLQALLVTEEAAATIPDSKQRHMEPAHIRAHLLLDELKPAVESLQRESASETLNKPLLILASERGRPDLVRMLLDCHADPDLLLDNGDSAMHMAAVNGHSTVVEVLLAAGADGTITDNSGQTPLQRAVANQHWSVAQVLLASGLDVGSFDAEQLLARAMKSGAWESIDVLLHRVDASLSASTLSRLICEAVRNGKESVVSHLLEKYPDPAQALVKEGKVALLAWASQGGHGGIVRVLLQHDSNVNTKDGENKTALARAIEAGQDEVATVLLEATGVDTSHRDSNSATVLAWRQNKG